MSTVSRNAPCPCGSGAKFKKCCANRKRRIVVCTAMRNCARPEYLQALERDRQRFEIVHLTEVGRPVVAARNSLAARALEVAMPDEYIVWIDDDAFWSLGTLERMVSVMDRCSEIDVLAGYFGGRDHFSPAFAWRDFNTGNPWSNENSFVDPGRNCGIGEVVVIQKTGLHFVLMRRGALERVGTAPFTLITQDWCEDFSFMFRALHAGLRVFVDTASFIAHIGDDGAVYLVGHPRGRIVNGNLVFPTQFDKPTGPRKLEPVRAYGLPSYGV